VGSHSETREEYENNLKMAMLKGTVFEALMNLVPVVDNSILFAMLTRCKITLRSSPSFHSHLSPNSKIE
jgi:hypothetical protein